jgi:hypothetical protein
MEQLGLDRAFNVVTFLWWVYLLLIWKVTQYCIGYDRINTFSFFLPLLMITNGIFVPFTGSINEIITAFPITTFYTYWLALAITYACLPIGILVANLFRRHRNTGLRTSFLQLREVTSTTAVKIYILAVAGLALFSLLQIYAQGRNFDLAAYVSGAMDYEQYAAHRYSFAKLTSGWDYYLYHKLPYSIAPIALIIVWNWKTLARWKRIAFVLLVTFAIVHTGHKMPLISVVLYLAVSRVILNRQLVVSRAVKITAVLAFLATVFLVLPLFYFLQGERSYTAALFWSLTRTLWEPSRGLQLYFEVYPAYHHFLYGMSVKTFAMIAGVNDYITPSVYIPSKVLGLNETSFPSLFIGEAWADFGYYGVVASSLISGFILQIYNVWFFNQQRPRLEEVALHLSIVLGSMHLLETNLITSFLSYGIVANFAIYLLLKIGSSGGLGEKRPLPATPAARPSS